MCRVELGYSTLGLYAQTGGVSFVQIGNFTVCDKSHVGNRVLTKNFSYNNRTRMHIENIQFQTRNAVKIAGMLLQGG